MGRWDLWRFDVGYDGFGRGSLCCVALCVVLCCGWSESRGPLRRKEHEPKPSVSLSFLMSSFIFSLVFIYFYSVIFLFFSPSWWILSLFIFFYKFKQNITSILRTYVPHFNQRQLEKLGDLITCAEGLRYAVLGQGSVSCGRVQSSLYYRAA